MIETQTDSTADTEPGSPAALREAYRAAWKARLLPVLTDEWQSADAIAAGLGEARHTVLERLKDLLPPGLAERRIVRIAAPVPAKPPKKKRRNTMLLQAQFRLPATK